MVKNHWAVLILAVVAIISVIAGIFIGRTINWAAEDDGNWTDKFKPDASKLVNYMTKGSGKGLGYDWLGNVTDTFGNRVVGSKRLEDAIDFVTKSLNVQGFDNVHTEDVPGLPYWVRGEETATLLQPRNYSMSILGIGYTVGTGSEGITADAVVVRSFDELKKLGKSKISGKIVVFNQPWTNYGESVAYRSGANQAAKYGAVASLTRSVTSFSVYSPHTGMMSYQQGVTKIPAACLTVEDAEMLWRMQQRRQKIRIHLKITSGILGMNVTSRNTVFELRGSERPNEIVLISGHFDSWDVGQGAMDDGAGCAVMWQALASIKALGMRPKRTIRVVLWTAEEFGMLGSTAYYNKHKTWLNETFVFVSESDEGVFRPTSLNATFNFRGNDTSFAQTSAIASLIRDLGIPVSVKKTTGGIGDVDLWAQDGVPGAFYLNYDAYDRYFIFHHTNADTMTVLKPEDLDYTGAIFGVFAHVIANMNHTLGS